MNDSQLLDELVSIRKRTQADLSCGAWRWLLVWAAASFGFVLALAVPGWHRLAGSYWLVMLPAAVAATVFLDVTNRTTDRRVRRRNWPYLAATLGITMANTVGSLVLPKPWMALWFWVVFCAGFGVLLSLEGERSVARALWVLGGVFAVMAPLSTDPAATSVVYGAIFVVALLTAAASDRSRR
jgi:hypothetical protein